MSPGLLRLMQRMLFRLDAFGFDVLYLVTGRRGS
jgi:hypothetical protein